MEPERGTTADVSHKCIPNVLPVCCSVLIHLLPGLALFCYRFLMPAGISTLQQAHDHAWARALALLAAHQQGAADAQAHLQHQLAQHWGHTPATQIGGGLPGQVLWLWVLPTAFYLVWQAVYWLIVQVCTVALATLENADCTLGERYLDWRRRRTGCSVLFASMQKALGRRCV